MGAVGWSRNVESGNLYKNAFTAQKAQYQVGRGLVLMKRTIFALLLILLLAISATGVIGDVSSAASPVWVEVARFSGGFPITGHLGQGTGDFNVSHSEWRVRWSIIPDVEVAKDYINGSDFSFSVIHGRYEDVGGVSGKLFSETKNGTLIIQNSEYRVFHIEYNIPIYATWEFIIEDNINSPLLDIVPPAISILSPENKTYHTENVTCTVIVNETSYINCFLDGSLVGVNQTLTGLSDGTHSFSVDAEDEAGNIGYSGTIIFTVDIPKSSPIVPTAWIMIAAVVILTVIGIILLVYFKKRRH